jgi:outer membrane protein assembly factor BamB
MYGYDASHNAVFTSSEPAYHWSFTARGKINGGLAVVGDTLYFDIFGRDLFALDRRDGRLLWRVRLPNIAMTTPVVADGLVVVGTGRDNVLVQTARRFIWGVAGGDEVAAFDARTGRKRWTYRTVGEDMPSPALARVGNRDAIVFGNGDGHIRALDITTGRLLWSVAVDGVSTMSSAAVANGIAYVLAGPAASMHRPDRVYAIRVTDGHLLWSEPYGNADDSPVVADGRVFVQDAQSVSGPSSNDAVNDVYALDALTGHLAWARNSGTGYFTKVGSSEEAIAGMADGGAFFESLSAARHFAAYDAQQGRVLWAIGTDAAVKMNAVAVNGRLYVGDTAGVLYAIDEGSGRVMMRRRFPQPFTCSSPVVVGSTLYLADGNRVLALRLP